MMKRLLLTMILLMTIVLLMGRILVTKTTSDAADENIKEQFEAKYQAWEEHRLKVRFSSRMSSYVECPQFQEIVKLGLPALPFIMEKVIEESTSWLGIAAGQITKVNFQGEWVKEERRFIFPHFPALKPGDNIWKYWWYEGRKQTPQRFKELYLEWKELKKEGRSKEAKEVYKKIEYLGIDALPFMIEKVEQGDLDLRPAISYLTDDKFSVDTEPEESLKWWKNNRKRWTIKDKSILEIEEIKDDIERTNTWIELIEKGEQIYRENAEIGLSTLPGTETVVNLLITKLDQGSLPVRRSIVSALGEIKYTTATTKNKAKEALTSKLEDEDPGVRKNAIRSLGELKDRDIIPFIEPLATEDPYSETREIFHDGKIEEVTVYPVREEAKRVLRQLEARQE